MIYYYPTVPCCGGGCWLLIIIIESNTFIWEVLQICPTSFLHQHLLEKLMQFLVFDTVNYGQSGFHCFELKGSKISAIASCWT